MTSAHFRYAVEHRPVPCTPAAGRIKGKLIPDLIGGTYELVFSVAGTECARGTAVSPGGGAVACDFPHTCGNGRKNVTVVITRQDDDSSRTQGPDSVCLAS